jgi:2-polyprenyl-3-methyl-5-hydroxy-6-metoxy-1,4-benzoquinol methylase
MLNRGNTVLDLKKVYNTKFFTGREWLRGRSREMTKHLDVMYGTPQHTLDVGAGIGDFTAAWLKRGVDAYALEGSKECLSKIVIPRERMIIADLRFPINLPVNVPQKYDLITCWEVAEHIEREYVVPFIQNLAKFVEDDGVLAMSICTLAGRYHCTVRELPWWLSHFKAAGFRHTGDEELFRELAGRPYIDKGGWDHRAGNLRMLGNNMVIFQRST